MEKKDETRASFPGILYAEPAALGIIANVMAAIIVAVENMTIEHTTPTSQLTAGIHLIVIGGVFQLFSGLMSFRRNDHFTASSLVFLASLWAMYGVNHVISQHVDREQLKLATVSSLVGYCAGLAILSICALAVNYIMPPLLISALFTLIFEAVGLFHTWGRRVAAGFELLIVLTGSYAVLVMVLKGITQRYVLPGFGNAPYNVLLIKSAGRANKQKEGKRITKYAEPFAMGYAGNIVPAALFAFYHFGYFSDFTVALPALLSVLFCQLFACYYCYLRHDNFHAVQFIMYSSFWLSRSLTEPSVITRASTGITFLQPNTYALIGLSFASLILVIGSLTQSVMVLINNAVFFILTIVSLSAIPDPAMRYMSATIAAIYAVCSIYMTFASLVNTIAEKTILFIGIEVVSYDAIKAFVRKMARMTCQTQQSEDRDYKEVELDRSIVDGVSFLGTSVSALAICGAFVSTTQEDWSDPNTAVVVLVTGILIQLFAMRLSFVTRTLSKSYSHLIAAAMWTTWSAVLYNGQLSSTLKSTAIGVACLHVTVVCLSISFTRLWIPYSILMQANALCLLLRCYDVIPYHAISPILALLGITSLYATLATFINGIVGSSVLPVGEPLLKMRSVEEETTETPCPLHSSKLTSGVREIAKIMDEGGICGVPTDTVYALSASCKFPESIVRIFDIKGRSREKPMCLCLAYLDQLSDVNPDFSPRLWAFMRRCYPGAISCVVKKGPWMERLGIAHAADYIGNPTSVCIRVPDSTPLAHLISLTGPVVLTSANPSGEPDSTHYDMVVNRLGTLLDGVLCDGYSRELVASTVVNCLRIDEGEISYFREGCYPKEKVDAIFAEVLASSPA